MEEQEKPMAAFPTPPPFYKHFTKENNIRLRQLRKEAQQANDGRPREIDIVSLPLELRYLIPPEPPTNGTFSTFGEDTSVDAPDPTLADFEEEQLFPDDPAVRLNPQAHLIAFSRSLLTTFLSLTGILAQDPELHVEKVKELRTIALNMHHLINQYRPHQARESLILEMENRVAQTREENAAIDRSKEKLMRLLDDLQRNGTAQAFREEFAKQEMRNKDNVAQETRINRQKSNWAALEQEMG